MVEALRETAEECAGKHGAHLIDLAVRGEKSTRVLEVFIDAEQGVNSDICADVSRTLMAAMDAQGLIDGAFRLEVSSPGIGRPLKYPWQYAKHIGRILEVRMAGGGGAEQGTLRAVDQAGITLEKGGERIGIPFDRLLEAKVRAPW